MVITVFLMVVNDNFNPIAIIQFNKLFCYNSNNPPVGLISGNNDFKSKKNVTFKSINDTSHKLFFL